MPRPIMLPALAWLLWRQPWTRWPFVGIAVVSLLGAFATGWLDEWIGALFRGGMAETTSWLNLSPSRFIGAWWLLIGVPLAAWLTWRGRLGLASLAVSPYLLPYYLLFGVSTGASTYVLGNDSGLRHPEQHLAVVGVHGQRPSTDLPLQLEGVRRRAQDVGQVDE